MVHEVHVQVKLCFGGVRTPGREPGHEQVLVIDVLVAVIQDCCKDLIGTVPKEKDPLMSAGFDSSSSNDLVKNCLLYTSPSPRDATLSRMPSSA